MAGAAAYLPEMIVREILRRAAFNMPALARLTGLKLGSLHQLSAGNDAAGPGARKKIAAAFRRHAAQLQADADLLDPPEPRP